MRPRTEKFLHRCRGWENLTLYVGGAWTKNTLGAGRSQNVGFAGITLSL